MFMIVDFGKYFSNISIIFIDPMKLVVSLIIITLDLYNKILSKANFFVNSKLVFVLSKYIFESRPLIS